MARPLADWSLLMLAVLGALDALYFVAVTYRWVAPDTRMVPTFCRMEAGACARIVDTRWARVFGLPNAVYGLAWYVFVAFVALTDLAGGSEGWCLILIAGAAATVAVSVLLFWSLVWRLKTPCPLCFFGHGINVAIFGVVLWRCVF